jgi:hypothetical protein
MEMIMSTRKSLISLIVIGIIALVTIVGARVSNAQQERNDMWQEPERSNQQEQDAEFPLRNGTPVVTGSWMLEINPTPGTGLPPEFKALITFDEGGGCVETVILPPVTTAHGAWVRTGRREFVFAIVHHLVDPQGNFVGTVKAKTNATFIGRDKFHAEFQGNLFDPNGNVIAPVSGVERGARIIPESF